MIDIRYKNIYDKFVEHYKYVHVNPWHEIDENQLNQLYNNAEDCLIRTLENMYR